MTAKMRYGALHKFELTLFVTCFMVHEKSIRKIKSIPNKNIIKANLYKLVNKYLFKHKRIFHISVTCPEIL